MSTDTKKATDSAQVDDIAQTLGVGQYSNRRSHYIKWGGIITAIIIVVIVAIQLFGNGNSPTFFYKTAEVVRGNLSITVTATGTLEPVNQVEVGSEISGTIKTVQVDFNDHIKQGQVLAVMVTDQQQAKVNQAKAELELAEAQVKQAEVTVFETKNKFHRAKELKKKDVYSGEDYDTAQAEYGRAKTSLLIAKAQVVEAQASLDAQQITLAKATIHSPIKGIVLDRDVEPGQTVAASLQTPVLFTLAEDLTKMELHVDVDEADVGQVKEELDAKFTVDAYVDRSFPAKITEVHFASQTVDGVVTYETVLWVDNSELLLRPGMTATADILVKQIDNALLIPNAALRFTPPAKDEQASKSSGNFMSQLMPRPPRDTKTRSRANENKNQPTVWILRDGKTIAIPVSTGSTNGIMTEVTSGDIKPGMAVIVSTMSSGQ